MDGPTLMQRCFVVVVRLFVNLLMRGSPISLRLQAHFVCAVLAECMRLGAREAEKTCSKTSLRMTVNNEITVIHFMRTFRYKVRKKSILSIEYINGERR